MTLDELQAARVTAGAAYAQASRDYLAAWTELHAIDMACGNANFGLGTHATFFEVPKLAVHPEFFPEPFAHVLASRQVNVRMEEIINSVAITA